MSESNIKKQCNYKNTDKNLDNSNRSNKMNESNTKRLCCKKNSSKESERKKKSYGG
jgi:hypothetical protein